MNMRLMLTGNETLQKINSELLNVLVDKVLELHKHLEQVERETYAKIRVERRAMPKNAHLVECYATGDEYIVVGHPRENDESHNCDEMGCSTVSHVLARFKKQPKPEQPAQPDDVANLKKRILQLESDVEWFLDRLKKISDNSVGVASDMARESILAHEADVRLRLRF